MKINFNSIKNKLIVAVSAISLLLISIAVTNFVHFNKITEIVEDIFTSKQPAYIIPLQLSKSLSNSNQALEYYLHTKNEDFEKQRVDIWEKELKPYSENLENLGKSLKNQKDYIQTERILFDLDNYKKKQDELAALVLNHTSSDSLDNLHLHSEISEKYIYYLLPLHQLIDDQLNLLLSNKEKSITSGIQSLFTIENRFRIIEITILTIALLLLITAIAFIYNKISESIKKVKEQADILSAGNLPQVITSNDELKSVIEEINALTVHLRNVKDFAHEVGKGNFDSNIQVFNNKGEVGKSLAEMRESLKKVAEQGRQRNWANEGFSLFNEVLRQNATDLNVLSDSIISNFVRYLNANQGSMFILNNNNGELTLEMTGCYAYNRKKYLKKELKPGEGLAGQCFLEKESIFMTEVPENYVSITSGLGMANPRCIFIVPVKLNEEVLGVIELASFSIFSQEEKDFIEKVSESIAASISSVKTNHTTKLLLKDSQELTTQLKLQEDEMKQNLEELHATQEEMGRMSEELNLRLQVLENSLPTAEIDLTTRFLKANEKFLEISGYKIEGLLKTDLLSLLPFSETKTAEIKNVISSQGKLEDELKIIKKSGDVIKIKFYLNPVLNSRGDIQSYIFICHEVSALKENLATKDNQQVGEESNEGLRIKKEMLDSLNKDENELLLQLKQNKDRLKAALKNEKV